MNRRIRVLAWLVLITQVLIVATGGAVRLTGSGLGCDTWPKCTADSFTSNPEMGIHAYIEFGNRLLFFVLEIVALLAVFFIWKLRKQRPQLLWLAIIAALSVFIQAIIGGITVLSGLNPWVVGLHFVASVVLVVLATLLVARVYSEPGPRALGVTLPTLQMAWCMVIAGAVVVVLGIITTGSGPHAGDGGAARNGLNPELVQTAHAASAYLTLLFMVVTWWLARQDGARSTQRWIVTGFVVILLQIIVGIAQARLALPPVLVGIHMVLACLLAACLTMALIDTRMPVGRIRPELRTDREKRVTAT